MKLLRLPARMDDLARWWQWGDSCDVTILLPGDALLSETLRLPEGVTTTNQAKQWLLASPDVCQWRPDKEKLLRLHCEGELCYYWAVENELWLQWQTLVEKLAPGARWLPDWMLLPLPANARPFVMKADDIILFRHESGSGGSLPSELHGLLEPLEPRALAVPGGKEGYPVSVAFLQRQIKRHSLRWPLSMMLLSWQSLLPSLLAVCAAFLVWQSAQALWLTLTRQPLAIQTVTQVLNAEPEGMSWSSSLAWLDTLQGAGPINLRHLQWSTYTINIDAVSPVRCQVLQRRLTSIHPAPSYHQSAQWCEIHLNKEEL
ncbi:MAG: hypothetical protein ACRCZ6_17755 [Kluyvera sp.]|uniref:hypothetical protein n=1 Tax=Kluyvera sp. TaxID=1538228 RepID=UPI003F3D50FC